MRALFATAVEEGLIRSNPAAGIRVAQRLGRDGSEESRVKALTDLELDERLANVPEDGRLLVEFVAYRGLRIGEVAGLQWRHIAEAPGVPSTLGHHRPRRDRSFTV